MYHIMIDETIDKECPICFDDIDQNSGFIIMDCCNKKIHIKCLIDWYINNPEKNLCFICNQRNNFCSEFVNNNNNNIETIIEIPNNTTYIETDIFQTRIGTSVSIINFIHKKILIIFTICIVIICLIVLPVLLAIYS